MRVVVTGGAGFIGSHLIEALVARGDTVTCIERLGAPRAWIAGLPLTFAPVGLDDDAALTSLLDGAELVFHLAGLTDATTPGAYYAVNTEGTAHLMRAAAALPSPPRVLLLSSLAAVGPNRDDGPLDSDTVPYPLSHYGHSKLLAEQVVHAYADRVPATILRLPSVYGPRERGVLKFFQLVRRGVALTVGGWDRQATFLYVQDTVQGLLAAAGASRAVGRTYCLGHPQPVSWEQFAAAAGRALGRRPRLVTVPAPLAWGIAAGSELCAYLRRSSAILNREKMREITQRRWVCDPSRAMAELGFDPRYDIERGVLATARWYRAAGWV